MSDEALTLIHQRLAQMERQMERLAELVGDIHAMVVGPLPQGDAPCLSCGASFYELPGLRCPNQTQHLHPGLACRSCAGTRKSKPLSVCRHPDFHLPTS